MKIRFSEYRPALALRNPVQTYWTGDFNLYSENQFVQSVVPNGCVELIIHLTHDHCELVKQDYWTHSPEFTLIGLQTGTYKVRFNQCVQVFGIRFNPEGLYTIFGISPAEFTATFESGRDVLGKAFSDYCSRVRECKTNEERIALTDQYLLRQMAGASVKFDYLRIAPEIIRKYQGLMTMKDLFMQVPISPRQLQREFKRKYGITAKEYIRLSRLNAIQRYMRSHEINLTDLSYEGEFADQSHFIREFRLLVGTNPTTFVKQREAFIVNPGDSRDF